MYVFSESRENIVAFVRGFESGASGECGFSKCLSDKLTNKYGIQAYATGWPDQVERLAVSTECDWFSAFRRVAKEILESR